MTNHWADIANATAVVAWGANPAENHPACMAHVNRARYPQQFFTSGDTRYNKKEADLLVIDPRRTRTALQVDPSRAGDRYVRIRPGTDIALANGLVSYIISQMETSGSTYLDGTVIDASAKTKFFAYLNQNYTRTYWTDGTASSPMVAANVFSTSGDAQGSSKYTDARFLVKSDGTDYERARIVASTGMTTSGAASASTVADFPLKAATIDADPDTVYNRLKAHCAPYTLSAVETICGCSQDDIKFIADAFIKNSRCSSAASPDATGTWPSGTSGEDARGSGYRATTMLYAMGITQHTCGSQNVKSFAVIQTLMGNMGRAGGGINALRGIHNVQGSTDMGLLYGNIPAYSGNPSVQYKAGADTLDASGVTVTSENAFGKYMDALWGTPLAGDNLAASGNYADAYVTGKMALQQRGFFNMTQKWFGASAYSTSIGRAKMDALYALWPKGNGHNHIKMFREMAAGRTKAAVVWGQNPCVTEPNQSKVRAGLYELDLLVVTDLFETETAACDRKPAGVTYLLPSCSYVEKAGSATNSGRTLQWRYQARLPRGNSKDDNELLLRLAKALDGQKAFKHIHDVWDAESITHTSAADYVYDDLYGTPYLYDGTGDFTAAGPLTVEYVTALGSRVDTAPTVIEASVTGAEAVADKIFREYAGRLDEGGTLWIYTEAYDYTNRTGKGRLAGNYTAWNIGNRAKSRDRQDPYGQFGYHKWGYSWLVNRRVLYNNNEVLGDQTDGFQGPDGASRFFVSTFGSTTPFAALNYTSAYRTVHQLKDQPDVTIVGSPVYNASSPHFVSAGVTYAGRFPAHTEPYESPASATELAKWGRNTTGYSTRYPSVPEAPAQYDLTYSGTKIAGRDKPVGNYPLVLTTIRCVEHFQGGPITRNNMWNVEAEPEPWIELNSADAREYGITDGDYVKIVTARTEDFTDHEVESDYPAALYGAGFRARVGVGLPSDQRVEPGVVAIPWHWGDRGLSTGSRANDLCIDAGDTNTWIPEYKACLCRIEKI